MSDNEKESKITGIRLTKAMYVYGRLASGANKIKDIQKATGWSYPCVYSAFKDLTEMGLIRGAREMSDYRAEPFIYTIIADADLPTGWTKDMCISMETPKILRFGGKKKEDRLGEHRDNPLTKALSKGEVYIPEDSLPSYQRYVEELRAIPKHGIKEIDDIIQATLDLVMERCRHINRKCPVCGGRLDVVGTKVTCLNRKCGANADSRKSFQMSIRMLEMLR